MGLVLNIHSPGGEMEITLNDDGASLGRGEAAQVRINDPSLSRRHSIISCRNEQWMINDAGSVNGTFINGQEVTPAGAQVKDGDIIKLGGSTTIRVKLGKVELVGQQVEGQKSHKKDSERLPRLALAAIIVFGTVLLAGVAALGKKLIEPSSVKPTPTATGGLSTVATATPTVTQTVTALMAPVGSVTPLPTPAVMTPYLKMSETEQYNFLSLKARHITRMMGNREYVFDREVLGYIKSYVDGYAKRVGNGSRTMWGEDMNLMLERATEYAPDIIAAFRREKTPIVLGLYIPVIESEYRKCLESPAKAVGLFQFLGPTAEHYGVSADKRCDEKLMAPAAAKYMKDRIKEFGTDSMSVALSIAGYNRNPASVRRDLQDVVDSKNNERSFWTLLARREELDHWFQNENVKYVPKFFAAAIVGENPISFGLQIRKLTTYDQPSSRQ